MSAAKEIRGKIKSVQNTQKITRAMEKVAMSKMRKAQERMGQARPYAQKMMEVMQRVAAASSDFTHPLMAERPVKRVTYLLVTTDRGLCGGLNINIFRRVLGEMKRHREEGVEVQFALLGSKGLSYFRRIGGTVLASATGLGDKPTVSQMLGVINAVTEAYENGETDRVYLVSSEFVNTMTQQPAVVQLLPAKAPESETTTEAGFGWDYLYEPTAPELMDTVIQRYVESIVYEAVVENAACEQSARMVAMKAASDNAGKIIDDLQLAYNKARQANITKELAEIVGGAAAIE